MTAHRVCIVFHDDGRVLFYPESEDSAELAARFRRLVTWLVEEPGALACAAGHHPPGGRCVGGVLASEDEL